MATIAERLQAVRDRLARAAAAASRRPESVTIVAVSKSRPADCIREAYAAGQSAFGESYLQEALAKMDGLADLPLEWHFVGPIQSNKTRAIAERFDWVHGVDRLKIAERLNAARPPHLPPLSVCVQVNLDDEAGKQGAPPTAVAELARDILKLPRLRLRGLMTIPRPSADPAKQRGPFAALRALREELIRQGLPLDTLSMGMSGDLEAAVAEGATLVRPGTAIFGERKTVGELNP